MLDLVRRSLAAKRLVRLITEDKITEDLRIAMFERWPPEDNRLSYLVSCESCLSVWAAAFVASRLTPSYLINVLAVSELVILVTKGVHRWES